MIINIVLTARAGQFNKLTSRRGGRSMILQWRSNKTCPRQNNDEQDSEQEKPKPFESIPGPKPCLPYLGTSWTYLPVVGSFSGLDGTESALLKHKMYGPIIREELVPNFPMITISEPSDIRKVFKSESLCPARPRIECLAEHRSSDLERYPHIGLVNMIGNEWRDMRTKMQPLMLSKELKGHFIESQNLTNHRLVEFVRNRAMRAKCNYENKSSKINSMAEQADDKTKEISRNNTGTSYIIDNVQEVISRYSMESVMKLSVSHEITCLDEMDSTMANEDGQNLISAAEIFFKSMSKLYHGSSLVDYLKLDKLKMQFSTSHDAIHDIMSKYIDKVITKFENDTVSKHERNTILDTLYATKSFPNRNDLKVAIVDLVAGGIYPLTSALTMAVYLLATNPHVQERLYDEIRQKTDQYKISRGANNDHLNLNAPLLDSMKYLRQCLKEVHRVLPTIPGIARNIQRDLVLSNYHVPENTLVFCNSMVTCRMEKYFERADEFIPERWDRKSSFRDISKNPDINFAMLQFGYGARKCIGYGFAELQLLMVVANLVNSFKIETVDKNSNTLNLEREFNFIISPKNAVKLRFVPRSQ